ncbi:MAG: hypothetical protein LBP80_10420 [Treponema sp.]|jgi:hypothetical protein|nr:hypothetical protein [Treponema sp.]
MKDGTISDNIATGDRVGSGGGVYIRNGIIFTMSGGAISGNSATVPYSLVRKRGLVVRDGRRGLW